MQLRRNQPKSVGRGNDGAPRCRTVCGAAFGRMNGPSTPRAGDDGTLGSPAIDALTSLHRTVADEWSAAGRADLVTSLQRHPKLLRDRSLLLTLAVEEFRSRRQEVDATDLERYCS